MIGHYNLVGIQAPLLLVYVRILMATFILEEISDSFNIYVTFTQC